MPTFRVMEKKRALRKREKVESDQQAAGGKQALCCHESKEGNPLEGGNVQMCLLFVYLL